MNLLSDPISNEKAIEMWKEGNQEGFEVLYSRYRDQVYGFLRSKKLSHEDAEVVTQIVFAEASIKIHSYNDQYHFRSWLFTIASCRQIDFIRKNKKHRLTHSLSTEKHGETANIDLVDGGAVDPLDQAVLKDQICEVVRLLKNLDPIDQEVIKLRVWYGLTWKEIGEHLNITAEAARKRYKRAIEKLKQKLEQLNE
ncbi:MAG: sigma-70 family RNA polymerase sigma factor [Planctomycetota bacterium]